MSAAALSKSVTCLPSSSDFSASFLRFSYCASSPFFWISFALRCNSMRSSRSFRRLSAVSSAACASLSVLTFSVSSLRFACSASTSASVIWLFSVSIRIGISSSCLFSVDNVFEYFFWMSSVLFATFKSAMIGSYPPSSVAMDSLVMSPNRETRILRCSFQGILGNACGFVISLKMSSLTIPATAFL